MRLEKSLKVTDAIVGNEKSKLYNEKNDTNVKRSSPIKNETITADLCREGRLSFFIALIREVSTFIIRIQKN